MTGAWLVVGLCAAWVGWVYLGYPVALRMLRTLAPRPVRRADVSPRLSVVIAVHNGGAELP